MTKKPAIEAGDTILVELPVSAAWDGRITVEVSGIAFTQRVTIWADSDAIVEVRKAPKDSRRKPIFDVPD
jgi:hypothetical protein